MVTCQDVTFHKPPKMFRHEHGDHHDYKEYEATFMFKIVNITAIEPQLPINSFHLLSGRPIVSPKILRKFSA
jgi:hypothetical protein